MTYTQNTEYKQNNINPGIRNPNGKGGGCRTHQKNVHMWNNPHWKPTAAELEDVKTQIWVKRCGKRSGL